MNALSVIVVVGLGLIVGSFLNVLILRRGTGLSVVNGRSKCFSCGRTLGWYELLPLVSFVIQKGRCRSCKARISWQYPIIESATAGVFVLALRSAPELFMDPAASARFVILATLFSTYIAVVAYDIRHMIIPDGWAYFAAFAALGLVALDSMTTGGVDLARIIAGPGLFSFFYIIWLASSGRWMGLGDAKLALSVGWALGLSRGVAALLLSFWLGAIICIAYIASAAIARMIIRSFRNAKHRSAYENGMSLGLRSAIPFGPFLILGFLVVFAWGIDVQTILTHLAV